MAKVKKKVLRSSAKKKKQPSPLQLQKMYGNVPHVSLPDVERGALSLIGGDTPPVENRPCGHPDHYDEEIATEDVNVLAKYLSITEEQAEELQEVHIRMKPGSINAEAVAPGWGKCHDPDHYSVTYFLDLDTYPDHYKYPVAQEELERIHNTGVWRWSREQLLDLYLNKPMIEVCCAIVDEAYRVLGVKHIRVYTGPEGEHNVHLRAKPLAGSTIGLAYYPSGDCDDHVNHFEDTAYRPKLVSCCKLVCHEWGHNHGEGHQFRGQNIHRSIMSYNPPTEFYGFSTGNTPHTLPRDRSIDSLIQKYGGVPVPIEGDGPIPEPTDEICFVPDMDEDAWGRPICRNRIEIQGRTFLLTPEPFN